MEPRAWTSLSAAALQLSLAVTALVAGNRSQVARPLAAFGLCMFGWNFAVFGRLAFHEPMLSVLDSALTALSPALVFEVVLAFTGTARSFRAARLALWGELGALAAFSLGAFVSPRLYAWLDEPSWALAFLAGWLPSLAFEVWLLARHLRGTSDAREKSRARTVLSALAIGAAFATSDVARGLGLETPYLGAVGTVISGALLTTLAVRMELFDRNVSARTAAYVLAMTTAFVVAYLLVLRSFAGSLAAQTFGTLLVTLVVVAVARELVMARAEARERAQRLTVLGRFSAQMAHDLKSPLSALLGAVQVLEGESSDDAASKEMRAELLPLVAEQARRVASIVERYDKMGRVEPRLSLVRVNDVARAAARANGLPPACLALDAAEPECDADPDLLASAVENVVRNAVEACRSVAGAEGAVRIETAEDAARGVLLVRVTDRGPGMDARQRARAFDEFYTTKPSGSGLGLSFARRVMTAHGGDVRIESEHGRGTSVELWLPKSSR